MAGNLYQDNCNYTAISTIGTATIDAGPTPADPGYAGRFGVCYGYIAYAAGTAAMVVTLFDVQLVATGTGTTTTTNTLMSGTASAAGATIGAPGGIGLRYKGNLVVVTSGTAGAGNVLWD